MAALHVSPQKGSDEYIMKFLQKALEKNLNILYKWFEKFIWIFNLQKRNHVSYEVSYAKLNKINCI